MKETTYRDAGVDIELGDKASKILYDVSIQSWKNRVGLLGEVISPFDDFSGVRAIDVSNLPKGTLMGIGYDGVGTKVEVAERMQKFDTIAFDLLAMVCDDAIVRGAESVLAGSILDVNSLGSEGKNYLNNINDLAKGYLSAANEANVALLNGELAELGNSINGYGDFNFSWGSSVVWFAKKDRMFTGHEVKVGQKIIALKESGFRSNGLSLVRKILRDSYGQDWHLEDFEEQSIGDFVLHPSQIYSKYVTELLGGVMNSPIVKLNGVCHVTGGGIPGKLGRTLKASKLGAKLNNLMDVPSIIKHIQKIGNVPDFEAYKTWCMGQGMLILTEDTDDTLEYFSTTPIEAKLVGEVVAEPEITLVSKGNFQEGEELKYQL